MDELKKMFGMHTVLNLIQHSWEIFVQQNIEIGKHQDL